MEHSHKHTLVRLRYLWQKGQNFFLSSQKLDNHDDLFSKLLLISSALEVLMKSYIGVQMLSQRMNDNPESVLGDINKKFREFNHDLEKIFDETPNIKKHFEILRVKRENSSGFIDEFRIYIKGQNLPLMFKTLEASRYGSFAKENDVIAMSPSKREEQFIDRLVDITRKEIMKVSSEIS